MYFLQKRFKKTALLEVFSPFAICPTSCLKTEGLICAKRRKEEEFNYLKYKIGRIIQNFQVVATCETIVKGQMLQSIQKFLVKNDDKVVVDPEGFCAL